MLRPQKIIHRASTSRTSTRSGFRTGGPTWVDLHKISEALKQRVEAVQALYHAEDEETRAISNGVEDH